MDIDKKIEAVLFFKGEPISIKKLSGILNVSKDEIESGVKILKERLSGGIVLLEKDDEIMLGTAPDFGALVEGIIKEELQKDLGRAGLETLSIVLYLGPITRSRIDYIRGVNSNFILRNLMIRGLVEKTPNPEDQRSFLYKPTFTLLSYLGINNIENMPNYAKVRSDIEIFESSKQEVENDED